MIAGISIYDLKIDQTPIIEEIYKIKNVHKGVNRSNRGGWQSRESRTNITDPYEFMISPIKEVLEKSKTEHDKKDISPSIDFWFNINGPGHFNVPHVHLGTYWTAVYYLQVPKNSGDIIFHISETDRFNITPKENQLIIIPPDLRHEVSVNQSDRDRISIAFNFY